MTKSTARSPRFFAIRIVANAKTANEFGNTANHEKTHLKWRCPPNDALHNPLRHSGFRYRDRLGKPNDIVAQLSKLIASAEADATVSTTLPDRTTEGKATSVVVHRLFNELLRATFPLRFRFEGRKCACHNRHLPFAFGHSTRPNTAYHIVSNGMAFLLRTNCICTPGIRTFPSLKRRRGGFDRRCDTADNRGLRTIHTRFAFAMEKRLEECR